MQMRTLYRRMLTAWKAGVVLLAASGTLQAEPLLQSEPPPEQSSVTAPMDLRGDAVPSSGTDLIEPQPSLPDLPLAVQPAPIAPSKTPAPDLEPTLHSTIKETVRPLYDELKESGVIDTWHELKTDMGWRNETWERPGSTEAPVSAPPPEAGSLNTWQDPAVRPKSAAQAQLDRDYDAYLLQRLIDDVKPWIVGLIGVYLLGHLIKWIVNFMQWKAAHRRERRAARRSRRHAPRGQPSPGQDH